MKIPFSLWPLVNDVPVSALPLSLKVLMRPNAFIIFYQSPVSNLSFMQNLTPYLGRSLLDLPFLADPGAE